MELNICSEEEAPRRAKRKGIMLSLGVYRCHDVYKCLNHKILLSVLLWSLNGPCLGADAKPQGVLVEINPSKLDFGRVNATTGPLRLSFTIRNRGEQPVMITGVRSGCGCTVPRLSESLLATNKQTTVKVEVSISGLNGTFSKLVLIDVEGRPEPIAVPIQGTVIQDIWTDGSLVQCFKRDSSATAEANFEVRTIEWPSVKFEVSVGSQDVSVQELSRSKLDGVTVIRFRAVMSIPDGQANIRRDVILRPTNRNIRELNMSFLYRKQDVKQITTNRKAVEETKLSDDANIEQKKLVSLGVISRNGTYQFEFLAKKEQLRAGRLIAAEGLPQGVTIKLGSFDKSKPHAIRLSIHVDHETPLGPIDSRVRFMSRDDYVYDISLIGIVGPEQHLQKVNSGDQRVREHSGD